MNNYRIADHLSFLSKLMDIHGENSFKSKTYSIAAFHIEKLPEQLADTDKRLIARIKGIGAAAASKINELLETEKLTVLQDYIDNTPPGVVEMLHLKGLGPKKIHTIWREMAIQSIGELEYACNENRLTRYKGFGEKTQANVLESIKFYTQNIGLFLYSQIESIYPPIEIYLEKLFGRGNVVNTGDFRRQMLTISEIEFVVNNPIDAIKPKFQTAYPPELIEETDDTILYKLNNGLRLRLISETGNIYKKQFLTSASTEFIENFFEKFGKKIFENFNPESEEEIFEKALLPFIKPCLRETKTIIEKATSNNLPRLIETSDIKGIIHNHSNWSDGANTIEELATELIKNNFEYLVISDHSKTAAYANGLSVERIHEQHKYIDELNKKLAPFKIFKSIESDILNDGNLDYEDEVLKTFDLVIASVHSNLYMNKEKAMTRLLKAIENPYTTILGHPTGRLLLSRNGYPIDHGAIIDACVANGVVIEINANPRRLDLHWEWIECAISKNALLSIDPDAHSIEGLHDIRYGVLASQKGGLTAANNLSSYSREEFETFLKERRTLKNL